MYGSSRVVAQWGVPTLSVLFSRSMGLSTFFLYAQVCFQL